MPIIDAQVHAYERNHPGRPWTEALHGPPEVTGDDMVRAMDEAGVDGAILVSVYTMYRYDPSYAIEAWHSHPDRFAVVRPIDPSRPDAVDTVAQWAEFEGSVGIRFFLDIVGETEPRQLATVIDEATRHDLAINVHGSKQLQRIAQLAQAHPAAQFVIDHIALPQPLEPPPPPNPWANLDNLVPLARHDNIAVKISNACTLSHEPFPYRDIWDPLWRVFDAFGFDRCLWGTDWTRATGMLTYKQGVDAFLATDRLTETERAALMGGTLSRIYRWSPSGRASV